MPRQEIRKILGIEDAEIERPANPEFGDYSTNAVLKLAKKENKNSRQMAEDLVARIRAEAPDIFAKIEVAGPGFINFFLAPSYSQRQVAEIIKAGDDFGAVNIGQSKKVQVEFISANPTGPLTLGNGRGGFFGDVLANVLARAGFDVKREYFINDAGHQIEALGHSILGDDKAQYQGNYIDDLQKKLKDFLSEEPKIIGERAAAIIINEMIKPTIAERMKIKFDNWVSETREIHQDKVLMDEIKRKLMDDNLVYEQDGAIWFKSTEYGDDKPRVLITSSQTEKNGEPTYFLADAAYHYKKFIDSKFDKVIDIWGADHHGYVARLQAIGKALGGWNESKLKIIIMQMVRLFENGQEVRMSKRTGVYVTLDELLDEIPLDVARFFFLTRSPDTHMDFDLDLAKEQSQKNPVYYIQYAHARIHSILAKSEIRNPKSETNPKSKISNLKLELLIHHAELDLIKQLIRLPEVVEDTARDYQVHRLPQYALDLVRTFHKFYEECRVLPALNRAEGSGSGSDESDDVDETISQARLALCEATRIVLKNTLDLMGISAPEKM